MPHIEPPCNKFNQMPGNRSLASLAAALAAIEQDSNKDFVHGKTRK
jgi:hypothetical protein